MIDQHVHSSLSPDCEESLEDIVAHALKLNKRAVVTTDHFEYDCKFFKQDVVIDHAAYSQEVARLAALYPEIDIRKGIEVGYRREYLTEINDYLTRHSLDVVLLSAHNDGILDFSEEAYHRQPPEVMLRRYFEQLREAVARMDNFDILAHFDYVARYTRHPLEERDYAACRDVIQEILDILIQKDKVLELNTAGLYRQGWIHPHPYVLSLYTELGGRSVSLGSDAHQISRIEQGFDQALQLLAHYGIREIAHFKARKRYDVAFVIE